MATLLKRSLQKRLLATIRSYYTVKSETLSKEDQKIPRFIHSKMKAVGPITVADYMKEVLTNPMGGYYMHKDMFGEGGDFITSPELGQIFGEMIAVWFLNEWSKVGSPKPLQLVELGPGRGTLSADILRVFEHFNSLKSACLNLVEVSPVLSDLQARRLCMQSNLITDKDSVVYRQGISHQGVPVKWYRHVDDLPEAFTLLIAHEFFDALPVHKFQKTDAGFREVLVDIDATDDCRFRYVLASDETPASKIFTDAADTREHVEISPESLVLTKKIATRLERDGGFALIADYGHDGQGTDTFRAFKQHKLHDPLVEPGSADLTADVDFRALRKAATEERKVLAYGPVCQRDFLMRLGIEHRFKKLQESAAVKNQLEGLNYGYHMIVDEDKMGKRFKFMALLPAVLEDLLTKYPPVGFY